MRSKRKIRLAAAALASTLLLSACGGGSDTASTESNEELIAPPVVEVQASGGFNSPVKIASGVSFTLSEPTGFKPGNLLPANYLVSVTNNLKLI